MNKTEHVGIVKQVVAGDWCIVRDETGTPPAEHMIYMQHLRAPKIARRASFGSVEKPDEPWAWRSREYLRQKVIGKKITYKPMTIMGGTYCNVWLGSSATGENLLKAIVQEGFAFVRHEDKPTRLLTELKELEAYAKAAQVGIWSSVAPGQKVRIINWKPDLYELVRQHAKLPVPAIIEKVRDGSTVRAFLLLFGSASADTVYAYITLMMVGIRSPGYKLNDKGQPDRSIMVPFADEARCFVECRILQQDVYIVMESVCAGKIVGSIRHRRGDISVALLREGLAKCLDTLPSTGYENLRLAEEEAKKARKRLWKDLPEEAMAVVKPKETITEFCGVVIGIFNGDGVNVLMGNGEERAVFFSSIRAPVYICAKKEDAINWQKMFGHRINHKLYRVPWVFEAREFLRTTLICKTVRCRFDYSRVTSSDNATLKNYYTVRFGELNVAEALVRKGLAVYDRFRPDGTPLNVDSKFLDAWRDAVDKCAGIYSREKKGPMRIVDLTLQRTLIKRHYLPVWQRAEQTAAIVEFVASGARMRLYMPQHNCLVEFLLAGVLCPRASSYSNPKNNLGEPVGDEALDFTRYKVLHRNVKVKIIDMDKTGTAVIGCMWTPENENMSEALVEEGFARVLESRKTLEFYGELRAALNRAKAAKRGIWSEPDETKQDEAGYVSLEESHRPSGENYRNVHISHMPSSATFFVQFLEKADQFALMMEKLQTYYTTHPDEVGTASPKVGDLCAALFTYDGRWYRGYILNLLENAMATVVYIDYGTSSPVSLADIAELPGEFAVDQPYAVEYALAYVEMPSDGVDREDARRWLINKLENRQLQLNVEYSGEHTQPLARIRDPETLEDIGLQMLGQGLAVVAQDHKELMADLYETYMAAETEARTAHLGIWRCGECHRR